MADEAKTAEAPSGGGSKLVMILTLVNLIACIGIGGVLFISHKKQNTQPQISDIAASAEHADKADGHGAEKASGHGEAAPDAHGGTSAKKSNSDARTIPLEQFTVNLASPGGTAQKFVRVNIALEIPTEEIEKEVQAKMPQVRNAIIDLFNSKRPNDLVSAEQREYLKEEIRNALNSFMNNGKVKGVYFTNFAVTG